MVDTTYTSQNGGIYCFQLKFHTAAKKEDSEKKMKELGKGKPGMAGGGEGGEGRERKNATLVVSVSLISLLRPPLKNTFVYFYCLKRFRTTAAQYTRNSKIMFPSNVHLLGKRCKMYGHRSVFFSQPAADNSGAGQMSNIGPRF